MNEEELREKYKLLGSLRHFTEIFFKIRTGRHFKVSDPVGRESHFLSIWRELVRVFNGEINRLIINVPP